MAEYIGREALRDAIESIDWYSVFRGKLTTGAKSSENALYKANDIYAAIDNAPTADVAPVRRWIPVAERLPEEKVDCIVHYKHAYCDNDDYWAIGMCFYDGEKFQLGPAYKVTHWMPLPEPPKEERP